MKTVLIDNCGLNSVLVAHNFLVQLLRFKALNMNIVCKEALDETRTVLSELSVFLMTVQKRDPRAAHPALDRIAARLDDLASDIDDLEEFRPKRTGT